MTDRHSSAQVPGQGNSSGLGPSGAPGALSRALVAGVAFAVAWIGANLQLGSFGTLLPQSLAALAAALVPSLAIALAARRAIGREGAESGSFSAAETAVFGFLLALAALAGYVHDGEYFFCWWSERSGAVSFPRSGLFRFAALVPVAGIAAVLAARAAPRLSRSRLRPIFSIEALLAVLLAAGSVLSALSLLRFTRLWTPYSDDHPSFLFRLAEFWGSFPWLENYVPHWNAGVVNSVLASSGIPGYAFFTAPLHLVFGRPHLYHALGLALFHAVFAPSMALCGFRSCRFAWRTALVGAILVLCSHRLFFVWAFHFGTVGAAVSWASVPAALLFLYAVAELGNTGWRTVAGLVVSMSLLCAWPQMWLFAAVLAIAAASSFRRWLAPGGRRIAMALIAAAAATALLAAHSLLAVAMAKDIVGYTTEKPAAIPATALLASAWGVFRGLFAKNLMVQANPLVVVFGLAGFLSLRQRPLRRWVAILAVASAAAFSLGSVAFPNMQLYRMATPIAMVMSIPAAVRIGEALECGSPSSLPLKATVVLLLAFGAANTVRIYRGEGFAPFEPLDPSIRSLCGWISENVPEQSRVAFAGPTIHAYGHGHVAYLPILAGREMMACDYYGFPAGTYEPDFPPVAARRDKGGIRGYLLAHSVSHVVTCRRNYIEFFESKPDRFREAARFTYCNPDGDVDIRVFEVLGRRKGILRGASGRVSATFNRIEAEFDGDPPERAVLAYRWNPRLHAAPPAEIAPVQVRGNLQETFIEVRPNGARRIRIDYRPRL